MWQRLPETTSLRPTTVASPADVAAQADKGMCSSKNQPYNEEELRQTNRMINWMIASYICCLTLGWGLLFMDWAWNLARGHPKQEPWINDAVVIGGAAAVLSPIIQWGNTVLLSRGATSIARIRRQFYMGMWLVYTGIVATSLLVALVRFALNEDGTLHTFITTNSNHLVLARISASLISWTSSKVFIRYYRAKLAVGPML